MERICHLWDDLLDYIMILINNATSYLKIKVSVSIILFALIHFLYCPTKSLMALSSSI